MAKRCSKCRCTKPLDQFSRNRSRKDGYSHACKACCAVDNRRYRQTHAHEIAAQRHAAVPRLRAHKGAYHRLYYAAHKQALLQRDRERRQLKREYFREYNREYRELHREQITQRRHRYYQEHRTWLIARSTAYNQAHQEHRRAYHAMRQELRRMQQRALYRLNPAQAKARADRRRARKYGAALIERFTLPEIATRDGWRCHLCGQLVTRKTWSLDHLIPLVHGGTHTRLNVALAHRVCNSRRGTGRIPAQLRLLG